MGTDRIDLSWTPPLDEGGAEIEGYRIMVAGPTGGFTALVNHTGTAATSYSDTGLEPGTRQRYQVQAINDAGGGAEFEHRGGADGPGGCGRRR